jgi:hypothetical protein
VTIGPGNLNGIVTDRIDLQGPKVRRKKERNELALSSPFIDTHRAWAVVPQKIERIG